MSLTGATSVVVSVQTPLETSIVWTVIDVVIQSEFLMIGTGLLIAAFILSVLNGLIEIAVKLATFGGVILAVVGAINYYFPSLLPI